jgi:hypothetical protein
MGEVNLEFKYLDEFEFICKNILGCETVAHGKMSDFKTTEVKIF